MGALAGDRVQLSREDVTVMRAVADKYKAEIRQAGALLPVTQLSIVVFETRSLERRLKTYAVGLDLNRVDDEVVPENRRYVEQQLAVFAPERLDEFFAKLSPCGYRKTHYRELHVESTLVYDLPLPHPGYIDAFAAEIDRALPGYYCWFGRHSRHATIRALYREEN